MRSNDYPFVLLGGCHCGQLSVAFAATLDPMSMNPRACDCSFCQKHGAAYVSDPVGRLSITVKSSPALGRYRQGSHKAEFLFCRQCGVLTAVIVEHNARIYGAANARSLAGTANFGNVISASPQSLPPNEKISRWSQLWVPDVELVTSATS